MRSTELQTTYLVRARIGRSVTAAGGSLAKSNQKRDKERKTEDHGWNCLECRLELFRRWWKNAVSSREDECLGKNVKLKEMNERMK
jgi:hypothetical protein